MRYFCQALQNEDTVLLSDDLYDAHVKEGKQCVEEVCIQAYIIFYLFNFRFVQLFSFHSETM